MGGGLVGGEVGIYLARQGREVTVIEMKKLMAPETYAYYRNALLEHMDKYQIRQYTDTRCERFEADGVWICQGGKSFKVPADTCIYSLGMSPDKETGQELGKLAGNVPVVWIGDCRPESWATRSGAAIWRRCMRELEWKYRTDRQPLLCQCFSCFYHKLLKLSSPVLPYKTFIHGKVFFQGNKDNLFPCDCPVIILEDAHAFARRDKH